MGFLGGLIIGLFVGCLIGIFVMALLSANGHTEYCSSVDKRKVEDRNEF